jgi:hypothetical protein
MSHQIIGYYSFRREKLLKKFDQTLALISDSLVGLLGAEVANALLREARQEYENLIPEIPYISGIRAKMFNIFLLITAQELAVFKAMKKFRKTPAQAWEICHEALHLSLAKIPRWKRWLLRQLMFSSLVKKIIGRRASQKQKMSFGDFKVEYLVGEGDNFDIGVNYLQCGNYRFAMEHGGEDFAPYICLSDLALSDALGWGLLRTQTLADGCSHCDFRFKKGATTQISSKTPEVQTVIENIRKKEAD